MDINSISIMRKPLYCTGLFSKRQVISSKVSVVTKGRLNSNVLTRKWEIYVNRVTNCSRGR